MLVVIGDGFIGTVTLMMSEPESAAEKFLFVNLWLCDWSCGCTLKMFDL